MNGGPNQPRSCLARMQAPTINAEATKIFGWNHHGILVVAEDDDRLTWPERELIRQVGEKLYGRGHRREVSYG
uniref:Uncharacterized protein n=1 Tax=Magnetococcus massalia (strain MO-1) TaxID=451514 RepID=A0A1S7LJ60_MAGMO|nr:conserved protein of unknown function [Candidatus Magnetococcus massalia]